MSTVQHVFNSVGPPDFSGSAGAHCIDDAGNHYLCSGGYNWAKLIPEHLATIYMTTSSGTPPEPAPSQGAICTAQFSVAGVVDVWVTVNIGGESWQWHKIQQVVAPT